MKNILFIFIALSVHALAQTNTQAEQSPAVIGIPAASPTVKSVPLERTEIFGYSVEKRPLIAHILGSGSNTTLIFAAVHGNEVGTPGVVRLLREHLLKHPLNLNGRRVILVPVMNPDGLRRKSRRNARGVDINRNYPGTWRKPKPGERHKSGPSPASEPEARAMMNLVGKYPPQKIVSIHQPLHCLVFSGERSRPLALEMQKYNRYRMGDNVGYPTPGGFGGYCEHILKVPVVTLELPWQSSQAACKHNASALLAAIRFEK
jgi:protein MpaA